MVLALSQSQISAMEAHAERVYPEECCGLLIGNLDSSEAETVKSVTECVALNNEWTPEAIAELEADSKTKHRATG